MVLNYILLVSLFLNLDNGGQSIYQKNLKKTNKVLSKLWEDQSVSVKPIEFNEEVIKKYQLDTPELYSLVSGTGEQVAYLCMREAQSKADTYTYLIIYNSTLQVEHIEVLEYRENYGGEISSKRFLRQFKGSSSSKNLVVGSDIDGITGATISVKSLVHSLNNSNSELAKLKELGAI